ncbi:MAG: hypothetical protein CEE40_00275 [Chloroflexi bacterium B3_Chlor]|nr:MAG: hypothetical protein CEE40_00275 [Chloroflexi bacterium B3_Chlor]
MFGASGVQGLPWELLDIGHLSARYPSWGAYLGEGAVVGQVCHLNGTRFLIVRAASDSVAENSLKEFKQSFAENAAHAAKVVHGVLERARRS